MRRTQRKKQWSTWLNGGVPRPSGVKAQTTLSKRAFLFVKGAAGWTRSPVAEDAYNDEIPDGQASADSQSGARRWAPDAATAAPVPLCDQAAVEQEADQWAVLWAEGSQYMADTSLMDCQPPPILHVQSLRAAARSFPARTGLGADHISPRALDRLSDETLSGLCQLYAAIEVLGDWPLLANLLLIVLLPKPDGGRRPIGLFPTFIRVWMRARADLTRTWEAAHALPCLYGGAGMGAQRAAWQVSYRAEVAARNRLEYGQTLLDLVKAFEKIPHEHLIAAGKKHGYNGCCLRLALAAYRLVRSIGVDGAYSRTIVAVLGITAGSGFATAVLRLLLFDDVTELTCSWPLLMISLYVDDLTLEATRSSKYQVMYMLTAATEHVVNHLQHRLQLEVSAKKSVTVAGRPSIAAGVAGLSRTQKVSARSSTKLLGVASAGGRRRSVNVLKLRIKQLALRTPRIRALRRAGLSATRLVRAAGTPLVTYGADVTGMSCSHLRTARCAVARAVSAPGGGKSGARTEETDLSVLPHHPRLHHNPALGGRPELPPARRAHRRHPLQRVGGQAHERRP